MLISRERLFEQVPRSVDAPHTDTELINGLRVDPRFFPGIFRMTTGGTCTASVVGPATVLLAAHCVDHQAPITFVAGGRRVVSICEQAPGWRRGNQSEDWALCLLQFRLSGFPYETINVSPMPPPGTQIILTGYGCTQQGGVADGILRIGVSRAAVRHPRLPEETSTLYTLSDSSAGEAVLCPGDSGGPAFLFSGGLNSARSIVGINSRTTYKTHGFSLFAATGSPAGKKFFEDWANQHSQVICGVNTTDNCL
jgi:hypothetical protein